MDPIPTQLLDLHVRLDPRLGERLRRFAEASERTLGGSVRLLVKDGLDRLERFAEAAPISDPESERTD